MTNPSHRSALLGSLVKWLAGQPADCACIYSVTQSSEFIEENATHRVERMFNRLTVSIDLPPVQKRIEKRGAKS